VSREPLFCPESLVFHALITFSCKIISYIKIKQWTFVQFFPTFWPVLNVLLYIFSGLLGGFNHECLLFVSIRVIRLPDDRQVVYFLPVREVRGKFLQKAASKKGRKSGVLIKHPCLPC